MDRPKNYAAVFVILLLGTYLYYLQYHDSGGLVMNENSQVLALLAAAAKNLVITRRTQTRSCGINGPLPDPQCTPGAIFPNAIPQKICQSGYSKSVRSVSAKTKKLVYAEYGITYPQPTGGYEADHLIPLELGGSNDIANLFPEAAKPAPGFHEKDLVENYLHDEVCAGKINLSAAQKQIAHDWLAVYNLLTPDEIAALKAQKARWGD